MTIRIQSEFKAKLNKYKILLIETDTVPGIVTKVSDNISISKIYEIKNRNQMSPFAIFVSDLDMAKDFADINLEQENILKKHLPGYFTFILNARDDILKKISKNLTSESNGIYKIAIRIPKSQVILDIIRELNEPLVATSANISGKETPRTIDDVEEVIRNKVFYYDIEQKSSGVLNSTIVDITNKIPKIIRNGSGIFSKEID